MILWLGKKLLIVSGHNVLTGVPVIVEVVHNDTIFFGMLVSANFSQQLG